MIAALSILRIARTGTRGSGLESEQEKAASHGRLSRELLPWRMLLPATRNTPGSL
jgi:hypothetical protein